MSLTEAGRRCPKVVKMVNDVPDPHIIRLPHEQLHGALCMPDYRQRLGMGEVEGTVGTVPQVQNRTAARVPETGSQAALCCFMQ